VDVERAQLLIDRKFPNVFRGSRNVVVGPVAFVGLRSIPEMTPEAITRFGGRKSPLVLRPGRAATVSIDPGARDRAHFWYAGGDRSNRAKLPHTLRLAACDKDGAKSRAGAKPVTFWAGGFAFGPEPFCLRFTVTVEHRRRLPVAGGAC